MAILVFLVVHILAVVHNTISGNLFYPQKASAASGYTSLQAIERFLNRRNSDNWLDKVLRTYSRAVGVSQQWNTFAPVPPRLIISYQLLSLTGDQKSVVWSKKAPRSGTGWAYDPDVKLQYGLFNFGKAFQTRFVLSLGTRLALEAEEFVLEAEHSAVLDRGGSFFRTKPKRATMLRVRP